MCSLDVNEALVTKDYLLVNGREKVFPLGEIPFCLF